MLKRVAVREKSLLDEVRREVEVMVSLERARGKGGRRNESELPSELQRRGRADPSCVPPSCVHSPARVYRNYYEVIPTSSTS